MRGKTWSGGRSEIRTHGGLAPTAVFKTAALNHSAILPRRRCFASLLGARPAAPRPPFSRPSGRAGSKRSSGIFPSLERGPLPVGRRSAWALAGYGRNDPPAHHRRAVCRGFSRVPPGERPVGSRRRARAGRSQPRPPRAPGTLAPGPCPGPVAPANPNSRHIRRSAQVAGPGRFRPTSGSHRSAA